MEKETNKQTNKQTVKTSNNERKKSAAFGGIDPEAIRTTHGTNLMLNCRNNNSFAH